MEGNIKISVIIPVYNVERYLKECLDSVVNQTFQDIEIICINDGSTDSSLQILEEYSKKDNRIIIINQENQGQGVARNKGIEIAQGEYIAFVDPDDFIDFNTFKTVYNKFKETNVDIVQFDFTTFKNNRKLNGYQALNKRAKKMLGLKLKNNQIFSWKNFKYQDFTGLRLGAPDKIYSSKLIKDNNIRFAPTRHGEDNLFSIGAYLMANKILYLNKYFYHYRIRNDSAVHKLSDDNFCVFENVELLKAFLEKNNLFTNYEQAYRNYLMQAFALHYTNISKESSERYLKMCSDVLTKEEYNNFLSKTEPEYTLLQKVFSVKNHKIYGKKYKFLYIFGLRFLIKKSGSD